MKWEGMQEEEEGGGVDDVREEVKKEEKGGRMSERAGGKGREESGDMRGTPLNGHPQRRTPTI